MAKSKHQWVQIEIRTTPGAEAWVIVRYRSGTFTLPARASIAEVMRGVAEGWQLTRRRVAEDPGSVRVPLDEWLKLVHRLEDDQVAGDELGSDSSGGDRRL